MKLGEVDAHPALVRIELYEDIRAALTQALSDTLARLTSRENLERLLGKEPGCCDGQEPEWRVRPRGISVGDRSAGAAGRKNAREQRLDVAVANPAPESLTGREIEILKRIAHGESNKAIACALDLSVHTVKRHVANILGKLGVTSRVQAATWLSAHH